MTTLSTATSSPPSCLSGATEALLPRPAVLRKVVQESRNVATLWLEFEEPDRQASYRLLPGQFNMIYVPGVGEVPISVSGMPDDGPGIGHTIRFVGRVTRLLEKLEPGAVVGLRGPYGKSWPMERTAGRDVLIVAGGLGLAPLKLALQSVLKRRSEHGRLTLLYGAREPQDLLYTAEYDDWRGQGMDVQVTVDHADAAWKGTVGVVPVLLRRLPVVPANTLVMTCGPEIMMKYAAIEANALGIDREDIYLSQERNMHCAIGLCGHCQLGPEFVCKDGPVFTWGRMSRFMSHPNF